jgi:hypothetical protein
MQCERLAFKVFDAGWRGANGYPPARAAIAWVLSRPNAPSPILGARTEARLMIISQHRREIGARMLPPRHGQASLNFPTAFLGESRAGKQGITVNGRNFKTHSRSEQDGIC